MEFTEPVSDIALQLVDSLKVLDGRLEKRTFWRNWPFTFSPTLAEETHQSIDHSLV
jgi:hypothetical protein